MDVLIRSRTIVRRAVTRLCNDVISKIDSESAEVEIDVISKFETLKVKFEELQNLDAKVFEHMLEDKKSEEELEKESETCEEYLTRYFKARALMEKKNKETSAESVTEVENRIRKFKLPKLELRSFNGNIKDWLPFWSQFRKIDEDVNIDPSDKFQYLLQSTSPNSRAKELVESYPATAENYPKVIQSLKERFGQKDMLVEVYIRELLSLVMQNANSRYECSLSSLYDRLESHLRALDSLGVVTEMYDAMLFPLVESSIPEDLLRIWQRQSVDKTPKDRLKNLMKFLRHEITNEERISIAAEGFDTKRFKKPTERKINQKHEERISTATDLFAVKETKVNRLCCFCDGKHISNECFKARDMSLAQKRKVLSDKRCCFSCLVPGHTSRNCKVAVKCLMCQKKHFTIMCADLHVNNAEKNERKGINGAEFAPVKVADRSVESLHSSSLRSPDVFLQTLDVNLRNKQMNRRVRAIIDTGAQKSYILKSTAIEMGYEPIKEELLSHRLFGGDITKACQHKCYCIYLGNLDGRYQCSLEALDQNMICGDIPSIDNGPWTRELKAWNITLTDVQKTPGPIEVLIGADVAGKLFTGQRKELKNGLVAMETKLGWTLMGKVPETQKRGKMSSTVTTMFVEHVNISNLWNLELLGIRDPVEQKSTEEKKREIVQHFEETVHQRKDGRYEVHMPWKEGHLPLPENYDLAMKRLESTCQKLKRDALMNRYQEVFDEWLQEGIIEQVPQDEMYEPGHYLAHRPVVKENSTTKVRPVFDASARSPGNPSLNDCLETGINLIESIPNVLMKFRSGKIGVISDIKGAFLQIGLHRSDRNFLRFLWRDNGGKFVVFRHTRVVFGVTCSPFLLEAVINHHLSQERFLCERGERSWQPSNVDKLQSSFYVDNCVTSLDTEDELYNFIKEATEIMKKGQFDLRGWEYTCFNSCIPGCYESKVLGLVWNRVSDTLEISPDCLKFDDSGSVTKRKILSAVNRIYDPVGVACPFTLRPKLLLQATWKTKETWDADVLSDVKEEFLQWTRDLQFIGQIKIPRWFGGTCDVRLSIHTFCDASKLAYAAAVFIRCESVTGVAVQLVQARSRVAPIKKITIPRLELLAATIGARIHASILQNLNLYNVESYFWTDSMTVLAWIRRDDEWGVFVNNRVSEIKRLTSHEQWRHVPGIENPADLPSRGCNGKQLLQSRWWEGPVWLRKSMESWPSTGTDEDEQQITLEKKGCVKSTLMAIGNQKNTDFYYFSHYTSIVRMIGWMLRFRKNAGLQKDQRVKGDLSCNEYIEAEQRLLKVVQGESFNGVEDPKLAKLYPYADEDGVIRLQTKISYREDSRDFRHPVVLPDHKHPVVFRLILDIHRKSSHAGSQMMRSILREQYWILGGCHTIRAVINQCQVCKRFKAKKMEVVPNPLPEDRVREARVFEVVGLDFAGPLYVKTNAKDFQKVWVCLFTCAVYRAVHFELISSLSTDAFLQGFRRFIGRRGRPSIVYCDNATNFTGASNACNQINWNKMVSYSTVRKMQWKFNPPSSPWWGGWWERLVGVLKQLLRRVLGNAVLSYEEMQTILCDCEATVNKRPLTVVTENPADLEPLTPDMFLKDIDEVGVPDLNMIESENLDKRLRYRARLREQLLKRFRIEYLGQLKMQVQKHKSREITLNEIVLVGCDNKKRCEWPLARVVELLPGKDGRTRLVRLKTQRGFLLRPIQRLYPLEIMEQQIVDCESSFGEPIEHRDSSCLRDPKRSPVKTEQTETRLSKSGRRIKVPERLDL